MKRLLLATAALVLAPLAVLADATTPAAAADCKKPDLDATSTKMTRDTGAHDPMAESQAYLNCLKAYAEQERSAAQTHGAAANKAINDYNDFVKEVNDSQNRPKN